MIELQRSDLPSCQKQLEKWTEYMKELLLDIAQ